MKLLTFILSLVCLSGCELNNGHLLHETFDATNDPNHTDDVNRTYDVEDKDSKPASDFGVPNPDLPPPFESEVFNKKMLDYFCKDVDLTAPTIAQANIKYTDLGIQESNGEISMSKKTGTSDLCSTEANYAHWSCDFKDIQSALLPLACDWHVNHVIESKDKAIQLLHLWAVKNLYDPNVYQLKVFDGWKESTSWRTDEYKISTPEFTLPLPPGSSPITMSGNNGNFKIDALITNSEVKINWEGANPNDEHWVMLIQKGRIYETGFPWADTNGEKGETRFKSYNTNYIYRDPSGITHPRNMPQHYSETAGIRRAAGLLAKVLPLEIKAKVKERLYKNSLLYDIYHEDFSAFFTNSDFMYNLAEGILVYLSLYEENANERTKNYLIYKRYLEDLITLSPARTSTFKPDGTSHHHLMHYNTYMYAINPYIGILNLLQNSPYQIGRDQYANLRKVIFSLANMSNPFDELPFLSGRHPFRTYLQVWATSFEKLIELDSNYNFEDKLMETLFTFSKGEIPFPEEGFWQYNYGVTGMFRKGEWLTGILGCGPTFPAGEISPSSSGKNMYGRYQGYGTVMTMYRGKGPYNLYSASYEKSGFSKYGFGWDWNHWPGTTSIVLPWDKLLYKAYVYETNQKDFAGVLRFKPTSLFNGGEYGIFGMDFQQVNGPGYRDPSFKFKKSAFFFDGKILLLGSNIVNNDIVYPTHTTLFQNILHTTTMPHKENGVTIETFPFQKKYLGSTLHILDAFGNGYFIKDAKNVVTERKMQHTPSLDNMTATEADCKNSTTKNMGQHCFNDAPAALAYFDHQKTPSAGSYEFVLIPNAQNTNFSAYEGLDYRILRKDEIAHVVELPKKTTAMAIFKKNVNLEHAVFHSSDTPILLMGRIHMGRTGDSWSISVVNPFLNYRYHDPVALVPDTSSTVVLRLNAKWKLIDNAKQQVSVQEKGLITEFTIKTKDGEAVDFEIQRIP